MHSVSQLVGVSALASAIVIVSTPGWLAFARRTGLVDSADGVLKVQKNSVACVGGPMILAACSIAMWSFGALVPSLHFWWFVAILTTCLGVLDDVVVLSAGSKLVGQIALALLLVTGDSSLLLDWFEGPLNHVVTILWLVAVINAFNFVDVSDGLCAVVAAGVSLVLCAWGLLTDADEAAPCAALFGGAVGFLFFNWRPAKMYLGDSGSMFWGLALAAIVGRLRWTDNNVAAGVVVPLAVLCVPLFELTLVVAYRLRLSLPPHRGSPDHIALRLQAAGFSPETIALSALCATALAGAAGLRAALGTAAEAYVIAAIGIVACLLAGSWLWRLDPRFLRNDKEARVSDAARGSGGHVLR